MQRQLATGLGPYPSYGPSYVNKLFFHNGHPGNYPGNKYFQSNNQESLLAKSLNSSSFWLLAPAGIGTGVALIFACSLEIPSLPQVYAKENNVGNVIFIYSSIATLALALFIYCTLNENKGHLTTSFFPISLAVITLIIYFGAIYFLLYRLEPGSFTGDVGHELTDQFVSFLYYSITTFATAQDGDIKPTTIVAKILVSMEILFFIFIFTLGIVLFAS